VRLATLRNVAIIAGLAAIVAFTPQGGKTAGFVGAVLTLLITIMFVLLGVRAYQSYRTDIYGLGDQYRALLYGAIGVAILAMAGRVRLFDTGAGTAIWFALMFGASYALYVVFQRYRSDRAY
jgi:multisubunit Na+/H+ antiporter MnhB subunit